jgi:hypothetical protein
MSNAFQHFHDEALSAVILLLGSPFIYKGSTYQGIINDIELSNALEEGGFVESLSSIVVLPRTAIATPPKAGETMTIGGKKARIESVRQDEVAFEIHVKTAKK